MMFPIGRMIATLRKLARLSIFSSVIVFLLKAAAGLGGYLLFALIARVSGVEEFGTFSIFFSAAMLAGTAGSLGQHVFLVKEIPRAQLAGNLDLEASIYSFSFAATLIGAAAAGLVFFSSCLLLVPQYTAAAAAGGALLSFSYAISQTAVGALRIQDKILIAIAARDLLWRILTAAGIATLPWVFPDIYASAALALAIMGGALLGVVLWLGYIICRGIDSPAISLRGGLEYGWLKLSAGLGLVAVISSADLYIFSIALGPLVPASDVGAFFASLKTVEVINLFLMSVTLVVGPRIARAVAARDSQDLQGECNIAILMQGIPALASCLITIVLAPWLLSLFDPKFSEQASVLRVLAAGVLINALTGSTVLMLQLIGLHWRQVVLQGGSLLAALVFLPALANSFGLVGAAYAFVFSKLTWNVLAIWSIRRRVGVDPSCLGLVGTGSLSFKESLQRLKSDLLRR